METTNNVIMPGQTIGIIGGGQLGRMMAIEARYMGYKVVVLDPTPNCPASQVADKQVTAAYDDLKAIEKLCNLSDVITYEFENVDLKAASIIEGLGLLPQGAYALEVTQNREKEKQLINNLNLPTPKFSIVRTEKECQHVFAKLQFPAVIKTCSGGYDGKGQLKLNSKDDQQEAMNFVKRNQHCIIEEWLSFDKEISVILTRNKVGDITFFPVAENDHKDHILYQSTVPAQVSNTVTEEAIKAAKLIAEKMDVVGTFAIEIFVVGDEIYINEMAPRPHNSGHYTIEACNVSQFAQHVRAICGLPLKKVELLQPSIMVNILGEDMNRVLQTMKEDANGYIHLYGKEEIKHKRKMGHVTFIAKTEEDVLSEVKKFQEELVK